MMHAHRLEMKGYTAFVGLQIEQSQTDAKPHKRLLQELADCGPEDRANVMEFMSTYGGAPAKPEPAPAETEEVSEDFPGDGLGPVEGAEAGAAESAAGMSADQTDDQTEEETNSEDGEWEEGDLWLDGEKVPLLIKLPIKVQASRCGARAKSRAGARRSSSLLIQ